MNKESDYWKMSFQDRRTEEENAKGQLERNLRTRPEWDQGESLGSSIM